MIDTIERLRPSPWRVPNIRRKLKPAFDFVPVIFANGEDDDLPGLVAAVTNQRVQLDEKIYAEDEDIAVIGRQLRLKCNFLHIRGHGKPAPTGYGPHDVLVEQPQKCRHMLIENCFIRMGVKGK